MVRTRRTRERVHTNPLPAVVAAFSRVAKAGPRALAFVKKMYYFIQDHPELIVAAKTILSAAERISRKGKKK